MAERRSSSGVTWIIGLVLVAVLAWLVAGTEWSLLFDEEALLRGITIEDARRSGEDACDATIDFAALSARPSRVSIRRATGEEAVELDGGRGTLTYPEGSDGVSLRLTFEGALRKPSHADVTLAQQGCRLQPASLQSMPLLPF